MKKIFLLFTVCSSFLLSFSQSGVIPPTQWHRSDWFPEHPVNGPQTQDESGDEWWYDHKTSRDINGDINGFVCAGYMTGRNYFYDETLDDGVYVSSAGTTWDCKYFETQNNQRGSLFAAMGLVSVDGKRLEWYKKFSLGTFFKVIQLDDGSYVGVGESKATRDVSGDPLYYNPGQYPYPDNYFSSGDETTGFKSHIYVVKVDNSGNLLWEYIYGMQNFYTDPLYGETPQASVAYDMSSLGYDLIEAPSGNIRIVGQATSDDNSCLLDCEKACMLEIDDQGQLLEKEFIGTLSGETRAKAIEYKYVSSQWKYVISGVRFRASGVGEAPNNNHSTGAYQEVYAMCIDDQFPPTITWENL